MRRPKRGEGEFVAEVVMVLSTDYIGKTTNVRVGESFTMTPELTALEAIFPP